MAVVESLAEQPERGTHPRELVNLGIREYRQVFFKPYRVIYRVMGERVIIYLIADGRRDMQTLLALSAPFAVITMAIALRRGYSMEPEPESIVANICSSNMQDRESSKILRGNIDTLRGRLLDCTTDYDKAMCILDAYSPSIARLVRKHGTANGKRWKDFSKDIDTTYRTLAGTANQSVS
jgi:hypothetical protein